jgi:ethylene-insensitive protein 3
MGDQNPQQQQKFQFQLDHRNANIIGGQNQQQQQKFQFQLDDSFYGQGAMVGNNITEATSMPVNNPVFSSTENQFDHCKAFDSAFDTNVNDNITDFRFGSPFPSPPVDYSMDLIQKQDVGMWYV